MSADGINSAERIALLQAAVNDLGAVTVCHMRRMQLAAFEFSQVQSILIGALMQELARVIACGPPRAHRAHVGVVRDELQRLVAASAVAMGAFEPEAEGDQ